MSDNNDRLFQVPTDKPRVSEIYQVRAKNTSTFVVAVAMELYLALRLIACIGRRSSSLDPRIISRQFASPYSDLAI